MKHHGLLFNAEMVRAYLDGHKTQARFPITPRNSYFDGGPVYKEVRKEWSNFGWNEAWIDPGPSPLGNPGPYLKVPFWNNHRIYPRIQVDDLIWGRETWAEMCKEAAPYCSCYEEYEEKTSDPFPEYHYIEYRADTGNRYPGDWYEATGGDKEQLSADYIPKWKPSIHMPKKHARIWAEVISVKPQRIREITAEEVYSEGVRSEHYTIGTIGSNYSLVNVLFPELWNALYPGSWDRNDWVWRYEFKPVEKP